jgi:hypothetical protein
MLEIFHSAFQHAVTVEGTADSEHCPPLESSQSQHFPGQNPVFNNWFSKEPGSLGLLFYSFISSLPLGKALVVSFARDHSICLFRCYENS